jgi:hypothetical protein
MAGFFGAPAKTFASEAGDKSVAINNFFRHEARRQTLHDNDDPPH